MPDAAPPLQPAPYIWTGTPLAEARSLPARCYADADFFRAEMEAIHLRTWFLVGRLDEFPHPGDYRAIDTVGGPVLLVRDEAGTLRAHANFCRHRGALLLQGAGNVRSIRCPYHSWVYRLSGGLAGAPAMEATDGFDKAANGLVPVRLETWEGFVFLNFSNEAPSLLQDLGDLPDLLGSHAMADMVCTWRIDIPADCNWKLIIENAAETYHTGTVHAATVGAQKSVTFPSLGEWIGMQVLATDSIAVLDGRPTLPPIAGLSPQAQQGTFFVFLNPTTQFCCAQDCVWWLAIRPVAVDRSVVTIGGCFPRSTTALPDFPKHALPYQDRWEKVGREDVGILEGLQHALGSRCFTPGPLSWRDDLVHAFDQWVLARLQAHGGVPAV